jgi:hypothetical protein
MWLGSVRRVGCGGVVGREVAAGCHIKRRMAVDRPTNGHVDNVSSDEPGNHEDTESNVASGGVAQIFKQFCGLLLSGLVVLPSVQGLTGNIMSTRSMVHIMTSPTRIW